MRAFSRCVTTVIITFGGALGLAGCFGPGESRDSAAIAEAMQNAAPEVDAVIVGDASNGFVPVKTYDVYIPDLDDENLAPIVDSLLEAAAPYVTGTYPLEFVLYSTAYSEDPLVPMTPFNADPGVVAELELDADNDGDSDDGEGFFVIFPDDLQRAYGN